jgi:hypothetical protein
MNNDNNPISNLISLLKLFFSGELATIIAVFINASNLQRETAEKVQENRDYNERHPNRHRDRGYGLREMDNMSDLHFKRMFRMSRFAFNQLEVK